VGRQPPSESPAATGEIPHPVDRIQYSTGRGPCLDATAAGTGLRSMLSFRLFLEQDTLGSLNL